MELQERVSTSHLTTDAHGLVASNPDVSGSEEAVWLL